MVRTRRVTDTALHVAVTGARGVDVGDVDATLDEVRQLAGDAAFQLFDAEMVAGWRHLFHAAVNATLATQQGSAISKSLDVETILYASCQDQISKAFTLMGLSLHVKNVGILVISEDLLEAERLAAEIAEHLGSPDDEVLDVTSGKFERLKDVFEVGDEALATVGSDPYEALTSLIVEKGALLPLRR
ncbi:MAG TPA: KEOPS complex subunit Cgi121 [Candidatus Krumholzibacteriaceae bacterium]|nr:KEOPS complex subunit Cgi121 [Candidatus Krumholzibacteriaceae bacterium]